MTATRTSLYGLALSINDRSVERASRSGFPDNGWALRHRNAFRTPPSLAGGRRSVAAASVSYLIRAWLLYGDAHAERYGSRIGDDALLGDAWARIGVSLRDLLNGEIGDLDGGTCDAIILAALRSQDYDEDGETIVSSPARQRDQDDAPEPDDGLAGACLCHDAAVCPDSVSTAPELDRD